MNPFHNARVGLALGNGSARGWAHIGVIRALEEAGVRPDIVCGTSIGALVGAAYAAGELDHLEQWVLRLAVKDFVGFMDVSLSGGLFKGERLMDFFRQRFVDRPIEQLDMPFGAVATALHTGAEIWLRNGSTLDAVRASIALPGLLAPVLSDGMILVDGGLVNPVPVSLARAMGADILIAVDLGSDILGRHLRADSPHQSPSAVVGAWLHKLQESLGAPTREHPSDDPTMPNIFEVLASSLNIMQVRIARGRMAGEPPDLIVAPRLAHLRLLDFHRAQEAIQEGRRAVERIGQTLSLFQQLGKVSTSELAAKAEVSRSNEYSSPSRIREDTSGTRKPKNGSMTAQHTNTQSKEIEL
ncbi:MAG TPA: patatin-like phospholipase RssA [Lacipirellulaceae bacterium]|jgi:NTE family protein|nr:patatin-like phospholipase RssA [Lacipirellulaceae bacterium]